MAIRENSWINEKQVLPSAMWEHELTRIARIYTNCELKFLIRGHLRTGVAFGNVRTRMNTDYTDLRELVLPHF